jgi:ribonuclease P protein component
VPTLYRFDDPEVTRPDEADLSTQSPPPREDSRLPRAHEDQGRAQGAQPAAGEGAQAALCLTGRLSRRDRLTTSAEFQALFQRGKRIDRPSLIVLWREATEPTRVGFAVSRQLRHAVERNRVRRRLREAYRATRAAAPARAALVVIGRPAALRAPFEVLVGQMRSALGAIPGTRTAA